MHQVFLHLYISFIQRTSKFAPNFRSSVKLSSFVSRKRNRLHKVHVFAPHLLALFRNDRLLCCRNQGQFCSHYFHFVHFWIFIFSPAFDSHNQFSINSVIPCNSKYFTSLYTLDVFPHFFIFHHLFIHLSAQDQTPPAQNGAHLQYPHWRLTQDQPDLPSGQASF